MNLIEPCCTQKHWPALRRQLDDDKSVFFHGYGDLSLDELLPVIMTRYSETDMMLVCPALPDRAAELLLSWLNKTWARSDGRGHVNIIKALTIITDAKKSPLVMGWKENNPYPERLFVRDVQQRDTALLLPDLAFYGNLNLVHQSHFTTIATRNPCIISELREVYTSLR